MNLEFRMAISPAPAFYSTIFLATLSLRRLGCPYSNARIRVSVGDNATLDAIRAANPWSANFPVDWRTVPTERFADYSYYATAHNRYAEPTDADVVFLCDSDLCLIDRIDDLTELLGAPGRRTVAGLQAHFPPLPRFELEWRRLFAAAGLRPPDLNKRYSMDSADTHGRAPPYFNYGLVGFSRQAFNEARLIDDESCRVARELTHNSFFQAQIGLSLTISAAGLEVEQLPHAFNCANELGPFAAPESIRLHDVGEIRAIHYLRGNEFDRRAFLCNRAAYGAFMAEPNLNPVNRSLRNHVAALAPEVEFFVD